VGSILWYRLPEQNSSVRFATVFGLPLFFLALYILCLFFTLRDPQNQNQSSKALNMIFWMFPLTAVLICALLYASAFGIVSITPRLFPLFNGLTFIVIGNYLPKCKQNHTIGIRVKWALENAENWNATHRVGGRVWVFGGFVLAIGAFLPGNVPAFAQIVPLLLIGFFPFIYSYLFYRHQLKNGTVCKPIPTPFSWKKAANTAVPILIAVMILITLFTGNISYEYGADSFTIHASYWPDQTVAYDDIEQIEYRDTDNSGTRTNGYGSPQLLMGSFQNDEFGYYTRYSYTKCRACVVLTIHGKTLVLSGKDEAETSALYDALLARIS